MSPSRLVLFLVLAFSLSGCGNYTTSAVVKTSTGQTLIGTTTASLSGGTFQVAANDGLQCYGTYDSLDPQPTISAPITCNDGRVGTLLVTRTTDGLSGSGVALLSDGTEARIGFGRLSAGIAQTTYPSSTTAGLGDFSSPIVEQPVYRQTLLTPVSSNPNLGSDSAVSSENTPSRQSRSGVCDCPYDVMSNGQRCGGRSAWSRPGGTSPVCYSTESEVAPKPQSLLRPSCSETGSCFGDISVNTGRPKTTYVRGYCRKNGRCVGGYYRS